ncbi:hypothetical protein [Natrinema versiforme]|uniref:hypothetical protein n=1 Tax=Natrinema versiforme TaxID=88724 RepID=UPI0012695B60|nr:hypothetical protein [Natrinema versiforme]
MTDEENSEAEDDMSEGSTEDEPSEESLEDGSSEESPEESPEDNASEESPEDDASEESPEDDASEESPEESPEDVSSEGFPEEPSEDDASEESPEESPEDDSSEESPEDEDRDLHLSLHGAFNLGWNLQYLRQAGHNRYPAYSEDSEYVMNALSEVRSTLDTIGASPAVKSGIRSFEGELEEEYVEAEDEDAAEADDDGSTDDDGSSDDDELPTLSAGYGNRLTNKVETWRTVLRYELSQEHRFTIANAPVIDLEKILQSPSDLFEDDIWDRLPEQTKQDVKEGCMSLAAHCPTASVIMILRSIEDILRKWYKQELNEEADDPWGPVLGKLKNEFNERGEDPDVLSNLDYLRRKRNEVNHPNRSPSLHEASVTLAMASETITAMMEYVEVEDGLEIEDQD